jgi:hypothetical protein
MEFDANNLGGDPFESFRVMVKKSGTYNFHYRHFKSTYVYEDIVAEGVEDPHSFDFQRYRDMGDLNVWLNDKMRLRLGFNRFEKRGDSTTSLDVVHDEFELEEPVRETNNDYTLGFDYDVTDNVTIGLEEAIQKYENTNSLFLAGASPGSNLTNTAQLNFFFQDQPYDFDSFAHTVRVNARPIDRLTVVAAATFKNVDMNVDYSEQADGTSYAAGAPHYSEDLSGAGSITRDIQLYDVDTSLFVTDRLALIGAIRYHDFAQDGKMTVDSDENKGKWDYSIIGFDGGVQFQVSPAMVATGGLRHETRKVDISLTEAGESESETPPDTKLLGVFGNLSWQVLTALHLTTDYQLGSADDPFTLTSPTDHHRLRIRADYKMMSGLSVMGSYLLQKFENKDSDWTADQNQLELQIGYRRDKLNLALGYGLIQIKRDIDQAVTMGSTTKDFPNLYEGKTNLFTGQVRFDLNKTWALGGDVNFYDNKESEPVKQLNLRSYVEVALANNYLINVGYRYVDFNEDDGLNDYKANIAEFSVGYHW